MSRHQIVRRTARVVVATVVGAVAGAAIAYSAASAFTGTATGSGYGGTAGTLQVVANGASIHVVGAGFLANSAVEVVAGDFHTTVTADEVGAIDATLDGAGASVVATGASGISASGITPAGVATSMRRAASAPPSTSAPTLVGASLGVGPSIVMMRRRKPTDD